LRKVPAMTGDVTTAIPIAAKITFRFVLIVDPHLLHVACPAATIDANIVAAELTEMFRYCIGEMRRPLSAVFGGGDSIADEQPSPSAP
jgi:hypothetical protein